MALGDATPLAGPLSGSLQSWGDSEACRERHFTDERCRSPGTQQSLRLYRLQAFNSMPFSFPSQPDWDVFGGGRSSAMRFEGTGASHIMLCYSPPVGIVPDLAVLQRPRLWVWFTPHSLGCFNPEAVHCAVLFQSLCFTM